MKINLELKKDFRLKGQNPVMLGEIDSVNGYFITENGTFELSFFQEVGFVTPKIEKKKVVKIKRERKERKQFEYRFYFNDYSGNYVSANSTSIKDAKMQIPSWFSWKYDWDGNYTKHEINY